MKYISTIIILFTILNGCTSEKLSEQKLKQVIITGKEYATFEEKESRNDISGQLEENSIISFLQQRRYKCRKYTAYLHARSMELYFRTTMEY